MEEENDEGSPDFKDMVCLLSRSQLQRREQWEGILCVFSISFCQDKQLRNLKPCNLTRYTEWWKKEKENKMRDNLRESKIDILKTLCLYRYGRN